MKSGLQKERNEPRLQLYYEFLFFISNMLLTQPLIERDLQRKVGCQSSRLRKELLFFLDDFIKTTYDISLDSQISLFPRGFSPPLQTSGPLGRNLVDIWIIGNIFHYSSYVEISPLKKKKTKKAFR